MYRTWQSTRRVFFAVFPHCWWSHKIILFEAQATRSKRYGKVLIYSFCNQTAARGTCQKNKESRVQSHNSLCKLLSTVGVRLKRVAFELRSVTKRKKLEIYISTLSFNFLKITVRGIRQSENDRCFARYLLTVNGRRKRVVIEVEKTANVKAKKFVLRDFYSFPWEIRCVVKLFSLRRFVHSGSIPLKETNVNHVKVRFNRRRSVFTIWTPFA